MSFKAQEYFDILDKNRIPTGSTAPRGSTLRKGEYLLAVHVCIFNDKDEMLIQKRADTKRLHPSLWDLSCGGNAVAGEDSRAAAKRELYEELGLCLPEGISRPHFTVNYRDGFDDFYIMDCGIDTSRLTLSSDEVSAVRWATHDEINTMIQNSSFVPYCKSLISFLFECREHFGGRLDDPKSY